MAVGLNFNVLWRDNGATKGLKDLGSQADTTSGKLTKLGSSGGGGVEKAERRMASLGKTGLGAFKVAGGAAVAFGGAAAAGLAVAGGAAAAYGVSVASANEQAKISFTTMLGSGERAQKFLNDLSRFAASTPFELPELKEAASSLISAGINADKVIPIMRTLGDVTSGMGTGSEGVQRATIALQQMSAAGRITGEDLNQLRDAGIPVFDLLAKATGKSKEEVVKLAQSGKLGKKELGQMMEALESGKGLERFTGLMEKQSQSLAGTWSTLKDTVGQGLGSVMENALPLVKDGLGRLSQMATSAFGWVDKNRDSIGGMFDVARTSLNSFWRIGKAVLGAFFGGVGDGTNAVRGLAQFLEEHQADIVGVFVDLTRAVLSGADGLAQLASGGLRGLASLVEFTGEVRSAFLRTFGDILSAANAAFGWIPGISPKLSKASDDFKVMASVSEIASKMTADGMRGAADSIDSKLRPAIGKAQQALDKVGETEIVKAQMRDAAAKAANTIGDIGTKADGSQVKLKKFADVSKLSATEQASLKGRVKDAQKSLEDQYDAINQAEGGQKKLTKAWKDGKEKLYDEFVQMGLSNKEAKRLAARYAGVKPKVETKITTPGMSKAQGDVDDLKNKISDVKGKSVGINVGFKINGKVITYAQTGTVKIPLPFQRADGGVIPGRGGPRQDNIAGIDRATGIQTAWVSAREFVTNARQYTKNKEAVETINAGGEWDLIPRRAGGGTIRIPTTADAVRANMVSSTYDTLSSGLGSAAGKYAQAAAKRAQAAAEKAAAASGGGGGPVGKGGYAKALAYARRNAGHPYIFATLWDCSGFMSALHSIILGQSPRRRYSTPAFSGPKAQGFTRGKRSPFMVGVNPSPGRFGHMAGTLNGVNVESRGGDGVVVGPRARGWNAGMFSWRGGLADGGTVGDLPFDLLDKRGKHFSPELAAMIRAPHKRGGLVTRPSLVPMGEAGPERVLTDRQTAAFEQLVGRLDRGGAGGNTYVIQAPNYIGSRMELRDMIVKLAQSGQLRPLASKL